MTEAYTDDNWRTIEEPGRSGIGLPREILPALASHGELEGHLHAETSSGQGRRRAHTTPLERPTIGLPGHSGIEHARDDIDSTSQPSLMVMSASVSRAGCRLERPIRAVRMETE